jgi:CheY-like chemotaxis protein
LTYPALTDEMLLATISHEMRTLLYGMLASIELIGEAPLDHAQRDLVDIASSAGHSLNALLDNALDVAGLATEAMEATEAMASAEAAVQRSSPVDLCAVIGAAVGNFRARAKLKRLQLTTDVDPMLQGYRLEDAQALQQILHNFINNAIKFTVQGGVVITATLHIQNGCAQMALTVRDSGRGIDAADLEQLRRLFRSAANRQWLPAFTGPGALRTGALGLRICKRIADGLDADIAMESTPGQGSSVRLQMPLRSLAPFAGRADPPSPVPLPASPPSPPGLDQHVVNAGINVLIVDDDKINRTLLAHQLMHFGCNVTAAADGATALQHGPASDLIFTDLHLQDMTGDCLTRRWRANGVRCPIIAVTASRSLGLCQRILAAGMDGVLGKPFDLDALASVLAAALASVPAPAAPPLKPDAVFVQPRIAQLPSDVLYVAAATITEDLAALARCKLHRDAGQLQKLAHRIHGGMAVLHMRPAAALCSAIEESIECHWEDQAFGLISPLCCMLSKIQDDIASRRK